MDKNIEDLYPLTPMQQGMLFHTLMTPGEGMYVEQWHCRIGAEIDLPVFEAALQALIERHAVLRTVFVWGKVQEPMQAVYRSLKVPVQQHDWRGMAPAEQAARYAQFLLDDRNLGFDLMRPPLLRFHLLRMDDASWRFVWTSHHILYDGWSFARLMGEFVQAYGALLRRQPPVLPAVRPYRDYIGWLKTRPLADAQAWWTQALAGFRSPTPIDVARNGGLPAAAGSGFGELWMRTPANATQRLLAFTRSAGITMNTLVQGAWAVLLSRCSRERDVVFGATVSGRAPELDGVEEMVGLFINSLPVRVDVDPQAPVLGWLQALQRRNAELRQFDHAPLWKLQEWSEVPAGGTLFDSLLVFENYPIDELLRAGGDILPITEVGLAEQSNHALTFGVVLTDRLEVLASHDRSRFDEATVQRLLDQLQTLLFAMAEQPQARLSSLDLVDAAERARLAAFNDSAAPRDDTPLAALFEAQVRRTPEAVAVVDGGTELSYRDLNARANRLAHWLRGEGVGPDQLVALMLPRGASTIAALLAVWKAGGAYLPLDPGLPAERLDYILRDAAPRLVIDEARLRALQPVLDGSPAHDPAPVSLAGHLAYVIYTSGSTGRPKGTMVSQRAVANLAAAHRSGLYGIPAAGAGAPMRTSVNAPFMFDVSISEFVQLFDGHTLCIVPDEVRQSTEAMIDFLRRMRLDVLECSALQLRHIVEQGGASQLPRFVLFGGDAVDAGLWKQLHRIAATQFFNLYGPTECTVDVCAGRPVPARPLPVIGRPHANLRLHVLDAQGREVPVGVPGELYIGGEGLARGYLGQPGLTAERFVPDPFARGERLYRSGDLVRWLEGGDLEFLRRVDDQLKIRGFRVEPAEIEAVLAQLPGVREAAVRLREDRPGEQRLVAYVAAALDTEQTAYWGQAFDEIYAEATAADQKFNTAGWNSSYDNVPIPPAQMQQWLQSTLQRILASQPRRVLEIGCGTGMILHGIAAACERYHGIDVSPQVVAQLEAGLDRSHYPACEIVLATGAAHELHWPPGTSFDTVIVNSVAQYFPNASYFARVVEQAIEVLPEGGTVFLGDIRHGGLFETFHSSLELHNAQPSTDLQRVAQSVSRIMQAESELLVDPAWFYALQARLPRIVHVEPLARSIDAVNELTKFRYDLRLTVAPRAGAAVPARVQPRWREAGGESPASLRMLIEAADGPVLALAHLTDSRLQADLLGRDWLRRAAQEGGGRSVEALRREQAALGQRGVTPAEVCAWGAARGWQVQVGVSSGDGGSFHAVLSREPVRVDWRALHEAELRRAPGMDHLANVPASSQLHRAARDRLMAHLKAHLPDYMLPTQLVLLERMPRTATGKLDRQALPAPELPEASGGPQLPRTPTEEILAGIWGRILGRERIGVDTNFFELGGHSLLATRVVSEVRAKLGIELPLRSLFEAPTVAELAARVELALQEQAGSALPPLAVQPPDAPPVLSFGQQRLWFLDQLETAGTAYNMSGAVRLSGRLDRPALRRAADEIVARHAALRSRFETVEGQPVLRIAPALPSLLREVDLGSLPADAREARARELAREEGAVPFALARGPLIRVTLLRLEETEHLLLFTLHHIIGDGWSIGVLVHELGTLYAAYVQGRLSPLPALAIQYPDFAAWQRQWLGGERQQEQLDYWRAQLQGAPALLALPTDRPRPAEQRYRGATLKFTVDAAQTAQLQALCRAQGVTLFMALQAVFSLLLWRLSGQADISVGTAIANRTRREVEPLVGLFANTLVLRSRIDPAMSFEALLQQVRATTLAAYAHQDLPFEQVVEALAPERSLSHQPLFQVMLLLQNTPPEDMRLPGLTLSVVEAEGATAKCDLTLNIVEGGGELHAGLEYDTDLFDAATVQRFGRRFATLLAGAVRTPQADVRLLPALGADEAALVGQAWSRGPRPEGEAPDVLSVFEAQAAAGPQRIAAVHAGERLSYAALDAASNRLAHHLRALGVGPEDRVGLCIPPSLPAITAILAVMKAGAAYVPLDPQHAGERFQRVLEDADLRLVVTDRASRAAVEAAPAPLLCLDDAADAIAGRPADAPARRLHRDQLAYLIYTSGSTGLPKAVQVRHGALANLMRSMAREPGMRAGDVLLSVTSLAFDLVIPDLFLPLVCGACTVYAGREASADPARIARLMEEERVSFMQATPSTWRMLVEQGWPAVGEGFTLLCGGEALPPELAQRLLEKLPAFWNMYGPTETTVWSTQRRITADSASNAIGLPLDATQVHVLDAAGLHAPIGVAGELFIAGDGLARGYFRRPDLTAERFVPDPHGAPGARMYRTGDLARWLPGGALEYLGRIDHQVKLRGFRIELGEIEAVLAALPEVAEAAVLAREDQPGDTRLVAYLVARGEPADEAVLRQALAARLPGYMHPAHLVWLPRMPLSPNGKLDRQALPAPDPAARRAGFVAPRSAQEQQLAGLWAEVLGVPQVGVHDNFFALGGHSLLATRLVSRIRSALQVELPLRALFESPTVAGLALQLATAGRDVTRIEPVPRDRPHALSFAQQRLWFLDQLEPGDASYHLPFALRLRGALDRAALQRALDGLVARHEVLRTRFVAQGDTVLQQVDAARPVELSQADLSAFPPAERQARVEWMAQEAARTPFDLAAGPLLRAGLVRLDADEHVLLLTLHHIACDGWSLGVIVSEMAALYAGRPLPALPVQYLDYAAWQRRRMEDGGLQPQLAYWQRQLAGAPGLIALPTDHPRPAVASHAGDVLTFVVPAVLTQRLRALAQGSQATLFMVLAAGLQLLLARLSGQADISLGTPIANRRRSEVEGLVGCFINLLVLRSRIDARDRFADLLAQVRTTTLDAYTHQDLPFELLVETLKPERDASHAPLFQVMLVLQNTPGAALELPGLVMEPLPVTATAAQFDLTLTLTEGPEQLYAALEYSTDLFDRATVEALAQRFVRLLDAASAAPQARLCELPLLSGAEQQALAAWNATAVDHPRGGTLHGLFEAQAARTPGATALVFGTDELTYAELDVRANRLAHHLRAHGVGPDARVALCLHRSVEMVVGLLGILKAGGAYVPLDPAYPAERLRFMLQDAQPLLLLTQQDLAEAWAGADLPVLSLDSEWERLADRPATRPEGGAAPGHLAYVIYTSGSTGRPKGVAIDHAGIVNRLQWMQDAYRLTPADRVLQKTPFSFDVSVWEFFWPLLEGATLVMARPGGHQDAGYLSGLIAAQGITTLHFVPPMLEAFLSAADLAACGSLRRVICSGQALPLETTQRFFAQLPRCELHNLYGPTEASVDVTAWACRRDTPLAFVPIGRPIANTQIHILDPDLNEVPAGVAGELHIAGVGLARGYLARPGLTAEKFIPNPFTATPGARMYRSGDLARRLPDGSIEYLGRLDHQVKVRGFRIELGEIEAALAALPPVREAVVMAREAGQGDQQLVAWVVPDGAAGEPPSAASLRAALSRSLPEHMIPTHVVFLPQLPLSPNGKVDRTALPAPDAARGAAGYVAPGTPAEQALCTLWAELLRLDRVGVHDDFFALGGHSLLATRLMSRLRAEQGVELPLRALFDAPTPAGLARAVVAAGRGQQLSPIAAARRDRPLPLSFGQQRLWFLDQLEAGSTAYQIPVALRLRGALDLAALRQAFDAIVQRHESLRTRFATVDGQPVQVIGEARPLELPLVDLGSLAAEAREARARALADEEAATLFDLARGPLLRVRLLRLDAAEHVLLVTMHHIVSDGWSIEVLTREFVALYGAFATGQAAPLAPLALQYADFAAWQREHLAGDALEAQRRYWVRQLGGAPTLLMLPTDRPRPSVQGYAGASVDFVIPSATTAALGALGQRLQATPFMTLAAAFSVLLSRCAGQAEVCLGTPVAGRQRADLESLIGLFINTLVLRCRVDGQASFEALLRQVRKTALDAYAHQDLPFEALVDSLKLERHLSHAPLFQALIQFDTAYAGEAQLPGLVLAQMPHESRVAKFDLSLFVVQKGSELHCSLEYKTELFEAATIERMAGHFRTLLDGIADAPATPVGDLPLLAPAERERILRDWNQTEAACPDIGLHTRFEQHALAHPSRPAVVVGRSALTYQQANLRANRLAHWLRSRGVGPDVKVAICMDRSVDLIVAMLAVLKAGGAYVPLDPSFPADRLAYMVEDSAAVIVLTHDALLQHLVEVRAELFRMDEDWWAKVDRLPDTDPVNLAHGDNLAYVIYTSGSTGRPKGVQITHRGIVNYLQWGLTGYPLRDGEIGSFTHLPLIFDASLTTLMIPLWGGKDVHLPLPGGHERIVDSMRAEQSLSMVKITPAHVDLMAAALLPAEVKTRVRTSVIGGDALMPAQVRTWLRYFPDTVIVNEYGPTETVVGCCVEYLNGRSPLQGSVPIGRPIANMQHYVLDGRGHPVPAGVVGELYIAGAGVARGYLNRPGLTAEKFMPDPFGPPGSRMYRAGDLARYLPDGRIDLLGRRDNQVKIRGFRIELGEIEAAIAELPGVGEAAVLARDHAGQKQLVAYVVTQANHGAAPDPRAWRAALQESLPDYMMPAHFVLMEALPLTPAGKVDRAALPEPGQHESEAAYVAPTTATEATLAGLWAGVLGLPRVGVDDNFFDVGGNSLLAVQLSSHVTRAFEVSLPLSLIFEAPTVARMARHIDESRLSIALTESSGDADGGADSLEI